MEKKGEIRLKKELCMVFGIHQESSLECMEVKFGAQNSLKAVHDQSDVDVSAGVLGGTQLLRGQLNLRRHVVVRTHQQYHSTKIKNVLNIAEVALGLP